MSGFESLRPHQYRCVKHYFIRPLAQLAERLPYKQDAGGSNRQGLPISLRSSVDRERQITNLEAARSSRAGEAILTVSKHTPRYTLFTIFAHRVELT